jgi:arylsulfatase
MRSLTDNRLRLVAAVALWSFAAGAASALEAGRAPNILVIWGNDVGIADIGAYADTDATPNIDRIAAGGALFTQAYAPQSGTAGRAAFLLGQNAFRTGLLTVGEPRSGHGIPDWAPSVADILGERGYVAGHFGLADVGSRDVHLPTNHGFDTFYGLVHEPALRNHPKARGIVRARADGWIEDTGPLDDDRVQTADDEFVDASIGFIERAAGDGTPFFAWLNTIQSPDEGPLAAHDEDVGRLLDRLEALGIADDTIVIYATDSAAGAGPAEGGVPDEAMRAPLLVRWPGVIEPATRVDDMIVHEDWLPTLASAAGAADIVARLGRGHRIDGRRYKVHIDGHDFLPRLAGERVPAPRDYVLFFDADGSLDGVRWTGARAHFRFLDTSFAGHVRSVRSHPVVTDLDGAALSRAADGGPTPGESTVVALNAFVESLSDYPSQENIGGGKDEATKRLFRSHAALESRVSAAQETRPRW